MKMLNAVKVEPVIPTKVEDGRVIYGALKPDGEDGKTHGQRIAVVLKRDDTVLETLLPLLAHFAVVVASPKPIKDAASLKSKYEEYGTSVVVLQGPGAIRDPEAVVPDGDAGEPDAVASEEEPGPGEEEGEPDGAGTIPEADAATDRPELDDEEEPLFRPEESRFGRFLESDPPKREWVIRDVLPLGVVGLLAAMGGAGKSTLAYLLAAAVTTGTRFLGLEIGEAGAFLYLAAEDEEDELHRRGLAVLSHLERDSQLVGEPFDREAIAERLHVVPRVAQDNLLTRTGSEGDVYRTALVDRVIEAASAIPDLRVIALDPKSRFAGGRANHEEDATRFIEALEAIREGTGATVLMTAHISQSGIREGGGQEIVRGSTALVDGARWVATLQQLRADQAKKYGLPRDEAGRYLRFEVPKNNYGPPFGGMWLRREAGGILVPTEVEEATTSDQETKADKDYTKIVGRLQILLRDKGPLTRNQVRPHSGLSGALGAGDKKVRAIIERAVRAGDLVDMRGDLYPPPMETR